jgi:hypothetical protein
MGFPLARKILASGSAIAGFDGPPFAAVVQTEPPPQVRVARGFPRSPAARGRSPRRTQLPHSLSLPLSGPLRTPLEVETIVNIH